MNSVFFRIQAYIRTPALREEEGSPFTLKRCKEIERRLSIYKLAHVFQGNFQKKYLRRR